MNKLVELLQDLFHFVENNGKVVDGFRSREIVLELKQALSDHAANKEGWVRVEDRLPNLGNKFWSLSSSPFPHPPKDHPRKREINLF